MRNEGGDAASCTALVGRGRNPAWTGRSIVLSFLILVLIWIDPLEGATDLKTLLPTKDLPSGWKLAQSPQTYTKKNLFEHVNGQAVLYLQYGFQGSVFAVFQNRTAPDDQIEVDIYDQGTVLHAFGIFSRVRNSHRPGGIGLDSDLDDQSIFFYKGRYFVMLYATESNQTLLKKLALAVSSRITDSSPPPREISLFPNEGLRAGSIQYFPEGLLGHAFLGRGFRAGYIDKAEERGGGEERSLTRDEPKEPHLFLAIFKSVRDAKDALKTFRDYVSKKGRIVSDIPPPLGPEAWRGEDPYQGQVIVLRKESYLLGAVGFKGKEGESDLEKLARQIR